jgi:hypothetical protein
MTQILRDDDGMEWACDYEPPPVGVRGVIVFTSRAGERRCRRAFETFGALVDEGRADPQRLRLALAEAKPCPEV